MVIVITSTYKSSTNYTPNKPPQHDQVCWACCLHRLRSGNTANALDLWDFVFHGFCPRWLATISPLKWVLSGYSLSGRSILYAITAQGLYSPYRTKTLLLQRWSPSDRVCLGLTASEIKFNSESSLSLGTDGTENATSKSYSVAWRHCCREEMVTVSSPSKVRVSRVVP